MPSIPIALTHRPTREGEAVTSHHVPFHTVLELANQAWAAVVDEVCAGSPSSRDLAVVSITAEFRRELFVGDAEWDVSLSRIGNSSMTAVVEVSQEGQPAVTVTAALVVIDREGRGSVKITPEQRVRLETLLAS